MRPYYNENQTIAKRGVFVLSLARIILGGLLMGLETSYLSYIESSIKQTFGTAVKGLRMFELGDQEIVLNGLGEHIPEKTGKAYFTNRGYEHVSVDLNGLNGAIVRDLTRPEQFQEWHGSWDVLTNAGTTEHVEPFESQYECFGIIHDCVKVGGLAIHLLPDVFEHDQHGTWKNHCRHYYSKSFFELLAKECSYELLSNTVINGLRCATVKKTKNVPFMRDRSTFLGAIAQRDPISHPTDIPRKLLKRMGVGRSLRRVGLRRFFPR